MKESATIEKILAGLKSGNVVPYLGPGVLKDVKSKSGDAPIPADSDSLILAMNNGQPMAPRLMYEFPRAAMNLELKKGRKYVERFLTETYGGKQWQRSALHDWLAQIKPAYVIDINRDTQLQESYSNKPHYLVVGIARVGGTDYRFKLYYYNGASYSEIKQEEATSNIPTLFKPMGTPIPEPSYIAADADYVDYITELMGGFAIPNYLKTVRKGKRYLFLGMKLGRDTERMVLSDMIYSSAADAGWALMPDATDKEKRFCRNRNIEVINMDWDELISISQSGYKDCVA